MKKFKSVADIGDGCVQLRHTYGTDLSKFNNLRLLKDGTLVYATTSSVVLQNLNDKKYILPHDSNGIGCVGVHVEKNIIAVGGRGFHPNIILYSYPSLEILQVLSGGAENGYASINFNSDGTLLVSLSTNPDYMLTVWQYDEARILLHSKAFGQDVYCVKFSPYDDRRLTTCGTGHIRFWSMTSTFTGLKLQGNIGKFGKVELSDVAVFVELADGKVVSGTETGHLLLWEGNFIKCRFIQKKDILCHTGYITYLDIHSTEGCIISGSLDGYIKWWSYDVIDSAEVDSDHSMDFMITPLAEYYIGPLIGISDMIASTSILVPTSDKVNDINHSENTRYFIINTTDGQTLKLEFPIDKSMKNPLLHSIQNHVTPTVSVINTFHAGKINSVCTSPNNVYMVTGGQDKMLRCWNYMTHTLITSRTFNTTITCIKWVPKTIDTSSSSDSVLVGFSDGIIRKMTLIQDNVTNTIVFQRTMIFKPHKSAVTDIAFNYQNTILATSGSDGIIFFFNCIEIDSISQAWKTICFVDFFPPTQYCHQLHWNITDTKLLCSCYGGVLREVAVEKLPQLIHETNEFKESIPTTLLPITIINAQLFITAPETVSRAVSQAVVNIDKLNISDTGGSVTTDTTTATTSAANMTTVPSNKTLNKFVTLSYQKAVYLNSSTSSSTITNNANTNTTSTHIVTGSMSIKDRYHLVDIPQSTTAALTATTPLASTHSANEENEVDEKSEVDDEPSELSLGAYDPYNKNGLKTPFITTITYSSTRKYILIGTSDGSFIIRRTDRYDYFIRIACHTHEVTSVAMSYDDQYVFTTGSDGIITNYQLNDTIITQKIHEKVEYLKEYSHQSLIGIDVIETSLDDLKSMPCTALVVTSSASSTIDTSPHSNTITIGTSTDMGVDIESHAYSIRDAKLKKEQDIRKQEASIRKEKLRIILNNLRNEYISIVQANQKLPVSTQLTSSDLLIDKQYFEYLQVKGQEMIQNIHQQYAYNAEKSIRLKHKAIQLIMKNMIFEEFSIAAFSITTDNDETDKNNNHIGGHQISLSLSASSRKDIQVSLLPSSVNVSSFRTRGVESLLSELFENNTHTHIQNQERDKNGLEPDFLPPPPHSASASSSHPPLSPSATTTNRLQLLSPTDGSIPPSTTLSATGNEQKNHMSTLHTMTNQETHSLSVAETRRLKRLERKQTLEIHDQNKPTDDSLNEEHTQLIDYAKSHVGDYCLKSSSTYDVPIEKRVNMTIKRQHLEIIEKYIIHLRMQFNEKFLQLRDKKYHYIQLIRIYNQRIRYIDMEIHGHPYDVITTNLPSSRSQSILWEPILNPLEFPECRDLVTQDEFGQYKVSRDNPNMSWDNIKSISHHYVSIDHVHDKTTPQSLHSNIHSASSNSDTSTTTTTTTTTTTMDTNNIDHDTKMIQSILPIQNCQSLLISSSSSSSSSTESGNTTTSQTLTDTIQSPINKPLLHVFDNTTPTTTTTTTKTNNNVSDKTKTTTSVAVLNIDKSAGKGTHTKNVSSKANLIMSSTTADITQIESKIPSLAFIHHSKKKRMVENGAITTEQKNQRTYRIQLLQYEKIQLLELIQSYIDDFNTSVYQLRQERYHILSQLKLSELKFIYLYQEYIILQSYEERDLNLQKKILHFTTEKLDITTQIETNKSSLDQYILEQTQWTQKITQIYEELEGMLPSEGEGVYNQILRKIFKKKIKRKKILTNTNSGSNGDKNGDGEGDNQEEDDEEEEEEEEDDDEDDDMNEDDDDDDEVVEDICPPTCDPHIYEKIILLRETRLDYDEALTDVNKHIDETKKMIERLKQKEKQLNKESNSADIEMEQFQRIKQSALNEIMVSVPLKLSQIYPFEGSGCMTSPSKDEDINTNIAETSMFSQSNIMKSTTTTTKKNIDSTTTTTTIAKIGGLTKEQEERQEQDEEDLLDPNERVIVENITLQSHVVINRSTLQQLDKRVLELYHECHTTENLLQQHSKEKSKLLREKKQRQEEIIVWETKCNELQTLKFGKLVDLEALEKEADSSQEHSVEHSIEEIEGEYELWEKNIQNEILKVQDECAKIIKVKTGLINQIAALTENKLHLDEAFRFKNTRKFNTTMKMTDSTEHKKELTELSKNVKEQAKRIENLKVELFMLKRKDTSSLTMPTLLPTPPPTSSSSSSSSTGIYSSTAAYMIANSKPSTAHITMNTISETYSNNTQTPPATTGISNSSNGGSSNHILLNTMSASSLNSSQKRSLLTKNPMTDSDTGSLMFPPIVQKSIT